MQSNALKETREPRSAEGRAPHSAREVLPQLSQRAGSAHQERADGRVSLSEVRSVVSCRKEKQVIRRREEYQVRRGCSIARCEFDRIAGAARIIQKAISAHSPRGDDDGDKTD